MTCIERRDLLMLHAAGALDEAEARPLLEHLARGCPRCAGVLAEAQAVLAELPLALAPADPPAALRERLLEHIRQTPRTEAQAAVTPLHARRAPRSWRAAWVPAAAAAAIVLAVSLAAFSWRQVALGRQIETQTAELSQARARADELERRAEAQLSELERLKQVAGRAAEVVPLVEQQEAELARLRTTLDEAQAIVAAREAELKHLRARLDDRETRIAAYRSPDVHVFQLASTEPQGRAWGRVFWDPSRRRWDFYVSGLEPAGIAKTYQLWFITADQRKVSAGTFDPGPDGRAELLDIRIPLDVGAVAAAAVTDEPAGGSLQPTGKIQVVGEVPKA